MAMHKGLPVAGYQPQSDERVDIVNTNKEVEERILRMIDNQAPVSDPRWSAIARTHFEIAFMAMNRAIFRPQRLVLDGDDTSGKR